jgi:hypothetical protein
MIISAHPIAARLRITWPKLAKFSTAAARRSLCRYYILWSAAGLLDRQGCSVNGFE